MELDQQIEKAIGWNEESNRLMDETGKPCTTTDTTTDRARISLALLHLSLEHYRGIISLIEHEILGSSLALFRPQVEVYVRGVWFDRCAQDAQVKSFLNGHQPPSFGSLINSIDKLEGYERGVLSKIKKKLWPILSDYTHGGTIQVKTRNTKDEIAYNFPPGYIAGVVASSVSFSLAASVALAKVADDAELANKLMALYQSIYVGAPKPVS